MEKIIEIPEGYEARIEGNKVILEKKESNDERTRKSLLEFLNDVWCMGKNANFDKWGKADCADWISYLEKNRESTWTEEDDNFERNILPRILNPNKWTLEQNNADKHYLEEFVNRQKNKSFEKQKEQKPAEDISQLIVKGKGVYKVCPHCKSRMIRDDSKVYTSMPPQYGYNCPKCGTIEFDTVMYDSPEIEEQKPAEWSDSVAKEMFIKALQRAVEQTKKGYELTDCDKHSWWEDFKAYSGIKPAEWSEDDKRIKQDIENLIHFALRDGSAVSPAANTTKEDAINWFKSLPERFNLQPKQEWREEDKKFIKELCNLLASIAKNNYVGGYYAPDLVSKLQSLLPQPITYVLDEPLGYDNDLNPIYPPINHWKPSDEQIRPLEYAIEYFKKKKNDTTYLESLLNDLNKL